LLEFSLPGKLAVGAIAFLENRLFITRHGLPLVLVYDTVSLKLTRKLSVPGLGWYTCGLAACGVNNYVFVYVSDYYNNCVRQVDLFGSEFRTWDVDVNPTGLSINSDRNILVAYYRVKKVEEYSLVGTLIRCYSDECSYWRTVQLVGNDVWLRNNGPRSRFCEEKHNFLFTNFHSVAKGSAIGASTSNSYFTASDSSGNILIADQNLNRIQVLNSSLSASRTLPLPANLALQVPFALSFDESRGRLYVGEYGGQKRVLVLSNVTDIGSMFNGVGD
jgi:hypothetical protein